jgi:RiboL-PSP-HEPN
MRSAGDLAEVYDYLNNTVAAPMSFDDLLRSKIVYSISAFDKLIHDRIRIGMVQIFAGKRPSTAKYLGESISLSIAKQLATTSTPPAELVFEQAIQAKLKIVSFQDPDKVTDGLSYIWNETQKWKRISAGIGMDEQSARTTLKLIVARRNAIVHEADMDPTTGLKLPITKTECDDAANFLLRLGTEISRLVT